MTRRLVVVRHGRTGWNLEGRAQGHTDVGLDEVGHEQAARTAPLLAAMEPVALWTSDLRRARETAGYVARAAGLEPRVDPRLREFDVGARAGLTLAEFAERFPAEHAGWVAGDPVGAVPGAESRADLLARAVPALAEALGATPEGRCTVVVGHGACLRVALAALIRWDAEAAERLRGMDNCGWSVVEDAGSGRGPRLASYNETAHPSVHEPDFASDSPVG